MRVLVAGANGRVGRLVVGRLSQIGHEPVAMIRDPVQADDVRDLGASDVVVADLQEEIAPERVAGFDAVVFTAGSGAHTGADKTIRVDLMGAIRLIGACVASTVGRFVMVSAMRTDDPDEGPERMRHYLAARMEADRWLERSELEWTILRPGRLTDEPGTGRIRAARHLDDHGEIPRADVAEVVAATLEIDITHRKIIEVLSGDTPIPEALARE